MLNPQVGSAGFYLLWVACFEIALYPNPTEADMELAVTVLITVAAAWSLCGCIAYCVNDFQMRGAGFGWLVLLCLTGPLTLPLWLALRPGCLIDRSSDGFEQAEDQLAVAAQLESLGDWDVSLSLVDDAADRWPEHAEYCENLSADIHRKFALQQT